MRTNGDHTADQTDDHTHVPTDALTVAEAAEALGITTEAARMRVKRGTLPSTRIDGTVYVIVDQPNLRPNGPNAGPNDQPNLRPNGSVGGANGRPNGSVGGANGRPNGHPDAGNVGTGALLAAKDETITALRDQLEAERQANRENRRIIAGLIERVPALEAARNGQEDAQGPPRVAGGVQDGEEPEGRSWWRRLFV